MKPNYLTPIKAYTVDVVRLVEEYKSVQQHMSDRKRPGTPVLIQKALTLVQDNIDSDILKTLPYTLEIATAIRNTYTFNTVSYRCIMPDTCYSWHTDFSQLCVHIPLITNEGCRFVYEDKAFYMPANGSVYIVNNERPHSFMNGGSVPRVHITFENFGSRPTR
jgi:hypothetical protein